MVGTAGFEPAASASRTLRAAKLRYVPIRKILGLTLAAGFWWRSVTLNAESAKARIRCGEAPKFGGPRAPLRKNGARRPEIDRVAPNNIRRSHPAPNNRLGSENRGIR